mmetsp:Transcript_11264/g.18960  ORF Transcript_11264/g.18960 Transcript_11264/m.18960 type:complete len:88 (+) Transcript_11264:249-512(+)
MDHNEFMDFLNIDMEVQDLQSRRKDSNILGVKDLKDSMMDSNLESEEDEQDNDACTASFRNFDFSKRETPNSALRHSKPAQSPLSGV